MMTPEASGGACRQDSARPECRSRSGGRRQLCSEMIASGDPGSGLRAGGQGQPVAANPSGGWGTQGVRLSEMGIDDTL